MNKNSKRGLKMNILQNNVKILLSFFVILSVLSSSITSARADGLGEKVPDDSAPDEIQVAMLDDNGSDQDRLIRFLKNQKQISLHTIEFSSGNFSSIIAALDQLQKFNEKHSLERQYHVAFLPFAITSQKLAEQNQNVNTLRKAIRTIHNEGTTVIVPAGDQSRNINGKNGTVIPAAFQETITFSYLDTFESKGSDGIIGNIGDVLLPDDKEGKIRLGSRSNFGGKQIDLGTHLTKDLLKRDGFTLTKNTKTAAAFGVREAASYKYSAYNDIEMVPSPGQTKQAFLTQGSDRGQDGWLKDPDDIQEPVLSLGMTYGANEDKNNTVPIGGGNGGGKTTVDVTIHPSADTVKYSKTGNGWNFLHSFGGDYSVKTFEFTCKDPNGTIQLLSIEEKSGFDGGDEYNEITISCSGSSFRWNP